MCPDSELYNTVPPAEPLSGRRGNNGWGWAHSLSENWQNNAKKLNNYETKLMIGIRSTYFWMILFFSHIIPVEFNGYVPLSHLKQILCLCSHVDIVACSWLFFRNEITRSPHHVAPGRYTHSVWLLYFLRKLQEEKGEGFLSFSDVLSGLVD